MPINREPPIYQGYVISMIGQQLGQQIEMAFKDAQNCVMSGTHRWADDETDMPNAARMIIADREAAEAAEREADAKHNAEMRRLAAEPKIKSIEALLAEKAASDALVDIPEDWRELHHFKQIAIAKAITGDEDAKMTKADAAAVIEEELLRRAEAPETDIPATPVVHKAGEGPEAGNRDDKPFAKDDAGNPITIEEKAELDERKFAEGEHDDEF